MLAVPAPSAYETILKLQSQLLSLALLSPCVYPVMCRFGARF
jgi:hypothetical protein